MFGETSALSLLVHVVGPVTVATYLALSLRRGGPTRLWRDAAILGLVIGVFAFWKRSITLYYHYHGPRHASGVDAWPWFPLVVGVSALTIQALGFRAVPTALRIVAATLAGMVILLAGTWIA